MKICGIDPSIDSSGQVVMTLDDNTLNIVDIQFYGYTSTKMYAIDEGNVHIAYLGNITDYRSKSMPERQEMTYGIIGSHLDGVSFVGMEDYATSKTKKASGSILQIAEFCGGIRYMLYTRGIGIINFGIMQIKRFATGNGNAGKPDMCLSFKNEFPQLYPDDIFAKLKQFESPHNDLCDAFWMCEVLRTCMRLEKFGPDSIENEKLVFLTTTVTRGALSLAESPLIKKGVPYESIRKRKKHKNQQEGTNDRSRTAKGKGRECQKQE